MVKRHTAQSEGHSNVLGSLWPRTVPLGTMGAWARLSSLWGTGCQLAAQSWGLHDASSRSHAPSSTRPELTGTALALEESLPDEDHDPTILTDSPVAMTTLFGLRRADFPAFAP